MGQQKFAAAAQFLRDLFERSGKGQDYQVSPEGEKPWLVGVFDRAADESRTNFSGLEFVVIRDVPNITGDGTDKFVQLARFDRHTLRHGIYTIGYADGDLRPVEGQSLKPHWFELTKLPGTEMSDVIRLAPLERRDRFFPITRGESRSRIRWLLDKLVEQSASLEPIEMASDLDLFR